MATFGWIIFIFGGAYVAANVGFIFFGMKGGLEAIPLMIVSAVVSAGLWVAFAFWISPFTFSFGVTP
jgi:hypothetical protein